MISDRKQFKGTKTTFLIFILIVTLVFPGKVLFPNRADAEPITLSVIGLYMAKGAVVGAVISTTKYLYEVVNDERVFDIDEMCTIVSVGAARGAVTGPIFGVLGIEFIGEIFDFTGGLALDDYLAELVSPILDPICVDLWLSRLLGPAGIIYLTYSVYEHYDELVQVFVPVVADMDSEGAFSGAPSDGDRLVISFARYDVESTSGEYRGIAGFSEEVKLSSSYILDDSHPRFSEISHITIEYLIERNGSLYSFDASGTAGSSPAGLSHFTASRILTGNELLYYANKPQNVEDYVNLGARVTAWDSSNAIISEDILGDIPEERIRVRIKQANNSFSNLTDGGVNQASGGYNFNVTYTNSDNIPPEYVRLILTPGGQYDLNPVLPGDTNYSDGNNVYFCSIELSAGTYNYHFEASDGTESVLEPESGDYTLTVSPTAAEFDIWAAPSTVAVFGSTTIYARVQDNSGFPVSGVSVDFSTIHPGIFSENNGTGFTDSITGPDGIATIKYEPNSSGTATIYAETDSGLFDQTSITVNAGATEIILSIDPPSSPSERYFVTAKFRDKTTGTVLQDKPVSFSLTPANLGQIEDAELETDTGGNADCYIQPLDDGQAVLTVTYDLTGESISQPVYMQMSMPTTFTAFQDCGTSGIDVDWSSNGELIAFTSGASIRFVHNMLESPSIWQTRTMDSSGDSFAVVFSPMGDQILYAGSNGDEELTVLQHDYPSGPISTIWAHDLTGGVDERSADWQGGFIATGLVTSSDDYGVYWYASNGAEHSRAPTIGDEDPRSVAINPSNTNRCVVIDHDGIIYEKSGSSLISKSTLGDHGRSAAWSADGQYIAVGGDSGIIKIFDGAWNPVITLSGHSGRVLGLDFSPDNQWLVASESVKSTLYRIGDWSPFRSGPGGVAVSWDPSSTFFVTSSGSICAPFDTFGPQITNLQPTNGFVTQSGSLEISGEISDPIGISNALLSVNGGNLITLSINELGEFSQIVSLSPGSNIVTIEATDGGGNSSSATITIERLTDSTGPSITDMSIAPPEGEIGTIFKVSATVSDLQSGVNPTTVHCLIQQPDESTLTTLLLYDDGTHGDTLVGDKIFEADWNSASTFEAIYYLDFHADDTEGNSRDVENGATISIYDLPSITYQSISPIDPTNYDPVTISAVINDSAGIASVTGWYSIDNGLIWTPISASLIEDVYIAQIPPQNVETVYYRFSASDRLGHNVTGTSHNYTVQLKNSVSVIATPSIVVEGGADTGSFRITRTGPTTSSLTVRFSMDGSAINGIDYPLISSPITISAGQSFTEVMLTAIDDSLQEENETATITIQNDVAYIVGTSSQASITIIDNSQLIDSDNDSISDDVENSSCTDPYDADTDDDGITDGVEDSNQNGVFDTGETDPCDLDTDGDGLQDGTEMGLTSAEIGPDTDPSVFIPDEDPATTTNPTNNDSDGDLIPDGVEDINRNGRVDAWEPDPTQATVDVIPDLDDDGDVDGNDLAALASFFDSLTDQDKLAAFSAMLGFNGFPVDGDGDGILDDGDYSGVAGDNPCVGGNTLLCDDNCPDDANTDQADSNSDGLGDLCDGTVNDCTDTHISGYWGDPEWNNKHSAEDGDWNTAAYVNLANKQLYMNHPYSNGGDRYWQFKYSSSNSQHTNFQCYDYDSDLWINVWAQTTAISGNTVTEPIPVGCLSIGQPIQLRVHSASSAEYYEGYVLCEP
jgi:hypothetical protein